jgi:anti-anti-sigma factor
MKINSGNAGLEISSSVLNGDPSLLVIALDGYLDTNNSILFTDTILKSIDEYAKAKMIVLDMGNLGYVSSMGIGSFVSILAHFKKKDYRMFIMRMNDKVRSVFDLLGFTSLFTFIADTSGIPFVRHPGDTDENVRECPSCKKRLMIRHPGKYRCPSCGSTMTVAADGRIAG